MTSPSDQLYHYTNITGANGIRQARVIKGPVTLSALKPQDYHNMEILESIWGQGKVPDNCKNRADWVVRVDGSKLDKTKMKKFNNAWQYSGDIKINATDVIAKPQCQRTGGGGDGGGGGGGTQTTPGAKYGPNTYYHYTSTAGANGIRQAGVIKGRVTLSKLKPEDYQRMEILESIWGKGKVPDNCKNRADWVVLVDGAKLDKSKLQQYNSSSYNYSGDIRISASDVIDKPRCQRTGGGGGGGGGRQTTSSAKYGNNTYYHYTSTAGANGIKQAGVIKGTVTLSTLKPEEHNRQDILESIWGKGKVPQNSQNKADWVVLVDGSKLDKSKLKQYNQSSYNYSGDKGLAQAMSSTNQDVNEQAEEVVVAVLVYRHGIQAMARTITTTTPTDSALKLSKRANT